MSCFLSTVQIHWCPFFRILSRRPLTPRPPIAGMMALRSDVAVVEDFPCPPRPTVVAAVVPSASSASRDVSPEPTFEQ